MQLERLLDVAGKAFPSAKDYDDFVLRRRLALEAQERQAAMDTAEKGRRRALRELAEQKFNWGRFLFWEWQNAALRNQPPIKDPVARSRYIAERAHGYTLMTQARFEMAALPC